MTVLKSSCLRRALLLVAFVTAALLLLTLSAGAELTCGHDVGADNGFCLELECGVGCEIPVLNVGDEENPADDVYEIENAGELYWFIRAAGSKAQNVTMRAKLMAHIVVNPDLLDERGDVNAAYTEPIHWLPATMINVEIDGDGYTVSGLYAVRDDGYPTGFFATAENVTVKNLGIIDSYFSSGNAYTGALFGEVLNKCVAENCFVLDSTVMGDKSAGLVGKLGYAGAVSTLRYCYTNIGSAVFACDAENSVSNCYYVAAEDTDALTGTENVNPADTKSVLLEKLKANNAESTWQQSCLRELPVLRGEHKYAFACLADCDNFAKCGHSRKDGEEGKLPHVYDNKCDYICNRCNRENVERKATKDQHYYTAVCDAACNECAFVRSNPEDHKYSNACDKYCNYCAFQRTPPVENHQYDYACDQYCKICHHDRRTDAAAHTFDNKCDMVCNVCGATRAGDHTFDNACDAECNDCQYKRPITHAFGDFAVVQEPTHFKEGAKERVCSICGYKESAAIEKLPGWPLWLILLVSIGGGFLLLIAGFAIYWFACKKRTFAHLIGRAPEQLAEKERKAKTEQYRREKEEKKQKRAAARAEEQANGEDTQHKE